MAGVSRLAGLLMDYESGRRSARMEPSSAATASAKDGTWWCMLLAMRNAETRYLCMLCPPLQASNEGAMPIKASRKVWRARYGWCDAHKLCACACSMQCALTISGGRASLRCWIHTGVCVYASFGYILWCIIQIISIWGFRFRALLRWHPRQKLLLQQVPKNRSHVITSGGILLVVSWWAAG